jgi:cellulose biosynthesis protein BcsQ
MESLHTLTTWLGKRWDDSGPLSRLCFFILAIFLGASLVWLLPFVHNFEELFRSANSTVQAFLFVFLLIGWAVLLLYSWERARRVNELKDAKRQADNRRIAAEEEARELQQRWNQLLEVECRSNAKLWSMEPTISPPSFVPRRNRRTRFLTILNLKGGVGKTTLASNLAACLAFDHQQPLRTLLIDLDFQGTLSGTTTDAVSLELQQRHQQLVNLLLTTDRADPQLVNRIAVPMNNIPGCQVILANDTLDDIEAELRDRFLLDRSQDPRFRFRLHLHRQAVFDYFDLVIFDCPPRVTTSVVNAVACTDYVLIPTKLDDGSIEAVPRTIAWLQRLGALCQAEIGVVASHVTLRNRDMVRADRDSYQTLRALIGLSDSPDTLFESVIPSSRTAISTQYGGVASINEEGRELFAQVVAELRQRMEI